MSSTSDYFKVNKYGQGNGETFLMSVELNKPQAHGCALSTLKDIEYVLKKKLILFVTSEKPTYEILGVIETQAKKIVTRYKERLSKENWLIRYFFGKEKAVDQVYQSIVRLINPPTIPISNDVMGMVLGFLKPEDLASTAAVSSRFNAPAKDLLTNRAKNYGYVP